MTAKSPLVYFPAPRRSLFCSQCGMPVNRRVPEGDYLLCLRDDDNTVYARRYVSVEDGKAAAWQM